MTETSPGPYPKYWLLFAAAPLLLLLHAFYCYPFFVDDVYISLRYAERLMDGHGLTWNDGEYVEGYSNLLWVLLTAGLGWIGFTMEGAARVLGIVSALLTMAVFAWHAWQARLGQWPLLAGFAVFVVTPPVAAWAISGMETSMVMLCAAWAAALCYRLLAEERFSDALWCSVPLALIVLLRPEGPVYVIAIALGLMATSSLPFMHRLRLAVLICLPPFLFFCAQLAFRLHEYEQWLPNTVLVKIAFSGSRLEHGFIYVVKAFFSFLPILLYALFNGCNAKRQGGPSATTRFMKFLTVVTFFLTFCIVMAGGDIFVAFRAFVPLVPLFILMTMHALALGMKEISIKKEGLFFSMVLAGYIWSQFAIDVNQVNHSAPSTTWVDNARNIGLTLKEKYADEQPLVAVHAAGAIAFYSQLPMLDVFGLNDAYLVRHRNTQKRFGTELAGHELFDGAYVESRKPDILAFDIPGLPPVCAEDFKKECDILLPQYRAETMHIPGHDVTIWIRKDSRKLQ